MRLIDADSLIEQLREADRKCSNDIIKGCIGLVQTQYTAYDVDAVIEQLKEESYFVIPRGKSTTYFADTVIDIGDAINIVKRGGVE